MRHTEVYSESGVIEVQSKSMLKTEEENGYSYFGNAFYALSRSHNQGMLIGSSYAFQQQDIAKELVLDAAAMAFNFDDRGVIDGGKMATADGLGGSEEDQDESKSIAKISQYACAYFVKSRTNTDTALFNIAANSVNLALPRTTAQKYDSTCALATTQFDYQQNGTYRVELANVGDTCIVVLDADGKVKYQVSATQSFRGFGVWSPNSVQMLTASPNNLAEICQKEILTLNQGDIILSMSDGIWGELEVEVAKKASESKALKLAPDALSSLIAGNTQQSICQLLAGIVGAAMANSLQKKNTLVKIVNGLEKINFPPEIQFIDQVMTYLTKNNLKTLADKLYQLLFENGEGDGMGYFKEKIGLIPLTYVLQDLKNRTLGDCSTINAVRLPYRLDELIRAFIRYPKNQLTLLTEISGYSRDELMISIQRLANERTITQPRMKAANQQFGLVFEPAILEQTYQLLNHYLAINQILKTAVNKSDALKQVDAYLDNVPSNLLKHFLVLITPKIKVEHRLFGMLRKSDEYTQYQAIIKKCSDRIDNESNLAPNSQSSNNGQGATNQPNSF